MMVKCDQLTVSCSAGCAGEDLTSWGLVSDDKDESQT